VSAHPEKCCPRTRNTAVHQPGDPLSAHPENTCPPTRNFHCPLTLLNAATGTAAACSNVRLAGLSTILSSRAQRYSANAPSPVPNTSSPGWNCVAFVPTASTRPEMSVSGIGLPRPAQPHRYARHVRSTRHLVPVRGINGSRANPYQNLIVLDDRRFHVLEFEHIGRTVPALDHRLHRVTPVLDRWSAGPAEPRRWRVRATVGRSPGTCRQHARCRTERRLGTDRGWAEVTACDSQRACVTSRSGRCVAPSWTSRPHRTRVPPRAGRDAPADHRQRCHRLVRIAGGCSA
jgi:hypothetical protein